MFWLIWLLLMILMPVLVGIQIWRVLRQNNLVDETLAVEAESELQEPFGQRSLQQ